MGGVTAVPPRLRALLRARLADAAARAAAAPRRATAPTSSAAACATRSSTASVDDSDIDIATDARPDAIEAARATGWADAVWLQGERFGTVGCEKDGERFEITTFRAEVYRPESRKPEVDVRRRHRDRSLAARLHGQRDGARARRARARRSATAGSPISRRGGCARRSRPRSRSATTRCACCARRASSRRSASSPTPSSSHAIEQMRERLADRQRGADPRRAVEAARRRRSVGRASGSSRAPASRDEFLPELNAMQLEQDPIHRHKDVLAHTIAVVAKTSPRLEAAARGAAARRRQAATRAATGRRA